MSNVTNVKWIFVGFVWFEFVSFLIIKIKI